MDLIQTLALSLLQGFTEFLPISSSAHLILVPVLTGWPDQGLAFDVAVHLGTLAAVVGYFRSEVFAITQAWFRSLRTQRLSPEARLAWAVLFGTIPVGLAGLLLQKFVASELRSPLIIAATTIVFGILLGWSDQLARQQRNEYELTWKDVACIGFAQALALIPGTSRSGITMTAGLMLGMTRQAAARFSFLLSIPVIALAAGLETIELLHEPAQPWSLLMIGALVAGISAYLCIHTFLRLIARLGMLPFVIYRLVLGVFLMWFFWP